YRLVSEGLDQLDLLFSHTLHKRRNLLCPSNGFTCHARNAVAVRITVIMGHLPPNKRISDYPSVCNSSSNAFASIRSRVSNPSVNHPYTGASSSRACCTLPWSRQRRARLTAASSSRPFALCA